MYRNGYLLRPLVLIASLGLVLSLLLPAINWARESARADECTDKLHKLALGFHAYNDAKNLLPPGEAGHSNGVFAFCQPYMEMDDTAQKLVAEIETWLDHDKEPGSGEGWWVSDATWAICSETFPIYICPAADTDAMNKAPRDIASARYAIVEKQVSLTVEMVKTENERLNAGLSTYATSAGVCGHLKVERLGRTGSFGDHRQGIFTTDRKMTVDRVLDGMSNTLAIGEYLGFNNDGGWKRRPTWPGAISIWTAQPIAKSAEEAHWGQFSSFHEGIVNFAFGDAAVRPLKNDIDLNVLRDLSGIRDGVKVEIK